ncbi:MAG: DUF4411 family protein [Phycisphaerae bacterium]|nr:DUF4411 family protein [Phycisphaerae bacterium]
MPIQYCLDANILITAWHGYYSPEIAPSYWDWLAERAREGRIFCTEIVKEEIKNKDDDLAEWIKIHPELIRNISDEQRGEEIQEKVRKIMSECPELVNFRKQKSEGDPFVIAHAWAVGATVVTKENKLGPNNPRMNIPDVCEHFSVPWTDDFGLLRQMGIRLSIQDY